MLYSDYSEQTWRNDADARERVEALREQAAMCDWQNDFRPQLCDGSGILEETYTDVDQADVVRCPGCPACDLERVEFTGTRQRAEESEIARATRRAPITPPRYREVA